MSITDFYRCEKCGNIVALIKKGGGTLTCCDEPMTKLEANSTDAATEKHVPDVIEGSIIKVTVGSTPHPMVPEHYIEWIALVTPNNIDLKFLNPGDDPHAEFAEVQSGTVYAYCNLHGLWKKDLAYRGDEIAADDGSCSPEFSKGCVFF